MIPLTCGKGEIREGVVRSSRVEYGIGGGDSRIGGVCGGGIGGGSVAVATVEGLGSSHELGFELKSGSERDWRRSCGRG